MRGLLQGNSNFQATRHLDVRNVVAVRTGKVTTTHLSGYVPVLILLIASVAASQTASDFSARYGYPEVERFVVQPGITMTASYAEDRSVCEMVIEPQHSIHKPADEAKSMPADAVSEMIDELVPRSQRGILLDHMIESMGAQELQVAIYQNVTINRLFSRNLPANHDLTRATVVRKDSACNSALAPRDFVPTIELRAADLHARYGDPDAERFAVHPGITLMVPYGADQAACQMVIEPTHSIILHAEPALYMRPEAVNKIIDEILPAADRGQPLLNLVTKSGCNDYELIEYQNITVSRFRHNCQPPTLEIEGTATVTRKSPSCGGDGN